MNPVSLGRLCQTWTSVLTQGLVLNMGLRGLPFLNFCINSRWTIDYRKVTIDI